jgi:tetratricopeptide (TPR) repeat protein
MKSDLFWTWYNNFAAPRLKGRAETFRKMFDHLDSFERPVHIVETGCIEDPENWAGNGCSTILFDHYVSVRPGSTVRSVDIVPDRVSMARRFVNEDAVEIRCGDSVHWLREWSKAEEVVDLLYLDASHFDWYHPVPAALHHLNELMAIMPVLHPRSMVVVDDSPAVMDDFPNLQIGGKGELVARYAFSVGADLQFLDYQAGWTNITARPSRDPDSITAIIKRAREHVEADRLTAAAPLYNLVLTLTLTPWTSLTRVARGEACAFFARLALSKKRLGVAADWLVEALRADPMAVDYRLMMAVRCYLPIGLIGAACSEAKKVTELDPQNATAWRTLGGLEHERRDLAAAVAACDRALELEPLNPDCVLDRAAVAMDMADYGKVRCLCSQLRGGGNYADAAHLLAMAAYRESCHEQAVELFDMAIKGGCRDAATAHWHKSQALEAIGRWPEAWEERALRAQSLARPELALPMRRFNVPLWNGQTNGRVHVHAEAGSGDNLCLVRYLPLLRDMGLEVCYETMPDLVDLVKFSMPGIEVIPRSPIYPDFLGKTFDYHIPIGDLQRAFGTTVDTVPWNGPYLQADPNRAETTPFGYGRRVGVCWSSGIRLNDSAWLAEYGCRKSMHFETLRPAIRENKGKFVSLQVGPERVQSSGIVAHVLPQKPTWADTAALVERLDLVITVDTAVAHLAGAMGKPVWVMCQRDACSWHFMCWRPGASWNERNPWYPTARVFRQHEFNRPHFWDDVVSDISSALREGISVAAE